MLNKPLKPASRAKHQPTHGMQIKAALKRQQVIDLITEKPRTTREVFELLKFSDHKGRALVDQLRAEGIIKCTGHRKVGKSSARIFGLVPKSDRKKQAEIFNRPVPEKVIKIIGPTMAWPLQKVACYGIWGLA